MVSGESSMTSDEDLGRQSAERHIRMPMKARPAKAWPWHCVVPGSLVQPWLTALTERSGLAIKDTIAPKIYEVLAATARRVDVTAPSVDVITLRTDVISPRRRWAKVVAGTAMLAAAGAAVAIVLRRRKHDGTCGAPGETADAGTGPQTAQDGQPRADADGSGAEADGSGAEADEADVSRQ